MKTLIIGGIKSGKSRLAESLATDTGKQVVVIVSATADDEEMRQRINRHRLSRPDAWQVVEEPIHIGGALRKCSTPHNVVIIDCLTLWLTNLLLTDDADLLRNECAVLLETLNDVRGDIIMVSNETSMGIIPMGELTRQFCDEAGLLHQQIANYCDNVTLTVAGLPMVLKENNNG